MRARRTSCTARVANGASKECASPGKCSICFATRLVRTAFQPTEDFNRGDNEGVGYFEVNQRRGLRWSAATAFLKPALRRPNLTLWTGAQALTAVVPKVVASAGLDVRHEGTVKTLHAGREMILAAGAVNSPHLLQLSGIGDPALLGQHGIPVAHALPLVGENLQDHLQLRMIFKVDGPADPQHTRQHRSSVRPAWASNTRCSGVAR